MKALLVFLLISFHSQAGLLIEPYAGFTARGSGNTGIDNVNYEHDFSGSIYGARLGAKFLALMAGFDYSQESFSLESTNDPAVSKDKMSKNQLGVFLGADLVFIRVWGTYFFSGKLKGEGDAVGGNQLFANTSEFSDASGYGLGAGFSLLPFVSLNLEYRTIEYGKYEITGGGRNYTEKANLDTVILSVSLPLNI